MIDNRTPVYTEVNTSRLIDAGKWNVHVNEAGQGHPLIMLHGTGPGATGWSNFSQNLLGLAGKYRVILMDAIGWGKSDPYPDGEAWSRSTVPVESLRAVMDALDIDKAALVGNSMGGGAALKFCATYPERVTHLVTMGVGFTGVNNFAAAGLSEGVKLIVETYRNPTPENFRRLINVMVYDPSFATDELLEQRSRDALANQEHLDRWLAGLPLGHGSSTHSVMGELMDKLTQFTMPAMLIHGRDDRVVPLEATMRATALIPDARAVILNRCGHWAQVEHRDEFNALVDMFVSRGESRTAATR